MSEILSGHQFLPERRYASAGISRHSSCVRPSVCLSHAGIVSNG